MLRYQDIIETLATGVIVQFDEEVSMRIARWGIADYNVSDPNTAGMVRTNKVDVLLSVPSADMQEWTQGLEPTKGGTVCPSEVLPPASTTGRVARVIPPRLSSWDQEPTNGGTVFPSEVLPPASTTGRVARAIPPRLSPPAPDAWKGICVLETPNIQPTDKSNPSAIMSTEFCTSKLLKGLYDGLRRFSGAKYRERAKSLTGRLECEKYLCM